jgi:intein/homing endonuclease
MTTAPEPTPTTGPEAILAALRTMNIDELEKEQREVIKGGKTTKRGRAVRLLNAIHGLRVNEIEPSQLMLTSIPVIPPKFRPFSLTGDTFLPGDANEVYRDLLEYRRLYNDTEKLMGRGGASEAYMDLVSAAKAAYGYGDSPNPKTRARQTKGFFKMVTGTNPKTSFYQAKMLSKPMDTVGRGVIIPDADLGMDDVGIPEEMAWKLYGNYVQRRLVRSGMSAPAALKHLVDRTPMARKALEDELPNRPVILTRSPAWHRFNAVGQRPRLVKGDAIRINTFITEGQNADFNGDQQVGKVLVLSEKGSEFENHILNLQCRLDDATVSAMKTTNMIPMFEVSTHTLHLCDMEDLPRGPLMVTNEKGRNGVIHFHHALPGMLAISFDETSGQTCWAPVLGVSVHLDREIEVVQLSNGRQIITDDDPRAVYGLDPHTMEMTRDTPSKAFERGIAVPCARDISAACAGLGSVEKLDIGNQSVWLDFDFGYLLGALCGDGWWDKRDYRDSGRSVYLSDLKGFVAAKVGAVLRGLFGPVNYSAQEFKAEETEGRYGDTVRHTFAGRRGNLDAFVQFCSQWMGGQSDESTSGSGNKKLPDMFLLAPLEFRRGLLTGLFDTDGSCSVSKAKGADQLLCQITTTSVRLAADIKFLCLTMGVHASVGFSKTTKRGNTSWICNVSSAGLKERGDLLKDLQTPGKRDNFLLTAVSGENTSLVHNKAAVPLAVFDLVQTDLVNPKVTKADRDNPGPDLGWKKHQQNMVVQWSKGKREGVISRPSARAVLDHLRELHVRRVIARDAALTLLRSGHVEMTPANTEILRAGVYATAAPFSADKDKESETFKLASIAKTASHVGGILGERRLWNLQKRLEALPVYRGALDSDLLKVWVRDILDQEHITWATVVEVQKTGIRETGYDLTVPGYETFMSADGVILSNTMSIHVPAGPAAIKDVREKMMASKMLWSIKDRGKTMGAPKHEQIIGLNMGQTPSGKRHQFTSNEEAMAAIESGAVDLNDDLDITP